MGSGVPSLELWPKLRRRIKECKTPKAKSKFNSYAFQGLEKYSVVHAELQSRRDSMVERIGPPVSMVRSMSMVSSRCVVPNNSEIVEDVAMASNNCCDGSVSPVSSSEMFFEADVNQFNTEYAKTSSVVGNVDTVRESRGSITNKLVDFTEDALDLDESVKMKAEDDFKLVFTREILSKDGFGGLELRGRKGLRSRRRSLCGRERRWRQVKKTAVTFVVILGIMAEKSANLAGSILAALMLGVVSPCRKRKQQFFCLLSDIVKHFQGYLHAYLSGLASKRLDFGHSQVQKCSQEDSSPSLPIPQQNSASAEASHSPQMSIASRDLASSLLVVGAPTSPEACSRPVSPAISPMGNARSPTTYAERSSSPSNKLNQFKTKMLKSFSPNRSAGDFRSHSFKSMPPNPTGCDFVQESVDSQSERWSSTLDTGVEDLGIRCTSLPDRVMKRKSFLERRSMLRNNDNGFNTSDTRSSSFSRSRFGSLRISISHSRDDFGTTSPADSSRSLRIGSVRISTSMKESPRRSFDTSNNRPSSSGEWKQRASVSSMEGLKVENVTPRQSQSSVASPFPAELGERRVSEMKRRHKHEAFLVAIFLVVLLFLIVGRAPAVLATSISVMFLCQLDKLQQSGGAGWDKDASRRSTSISRRLRTSESTYFSPRTSSPRTPGTFRGRGANNTTSTPISNECRRSICMGQFFGRSKRS